MAYSEVVDEYTLKVDIDELKDVYYEAQRLAGMKSHRAGYEYMLNYMFEVLGEPGAGA